MSGINLPTAQDRLRATLVKTKIPSREIKVYGSQVMITALSDSAAREWARLLHRICKTVRVAKGIDYTKEAGKRPNDKYRCTIEVYRVWGTI